MKDNDRIIELWEMVLDYSGEQQCDIKTAIEDLEFDGPNGSYGPTKEERAELLKMHEEDEQWEKEAAEYYGPGEDLKTFIPGVGMLVTNTGTGESGFFPLTFEGDN